MSFADAMREEGRFTRTENGAVALNTSGDTRLLRDLESLSAKQKRER